MEESNNEIRRQVEPYTVLAACYDVVMEHVEYDVWAAYVHQLLQEYYGSRPESILELGCGTGSFALELQPLGEYRYAGTDASEMMIRVAREKAALFGVPVQFEVADFTGFTVDPPVDIILLLYDGLNYLLEHEDISRLFATVHEALKPGGLFVFDQSTPSNSINNEAYFSDEGEREGVRYVRQSSYDRKQRLHSNSFDIVINGVVYHEDHLQRAYTLPEIKSLIKQTPFQILTSLDQFSREAAKLSSERIHWILRKKIWT